MMPSRAESSAGLYPMRLVTRLTGLSADTIRAWERRHGAVTPSRSSGNTRRFTADEVRRLVLLREATEGGHSIRSIAPLGLSELERLVARREVPLQVVPTADVPAGVGFRDLRKAYLGALARFDTRRAFDLLMRAATFLDRETFVLEVVRPVQREVKERWSTEALGTAQQKVVSGQLRSVLMALLRLNPPPAGASRLVLATLEGHPDEDQLLLAALLATAHGRDPIYIGTELPVAEIEWAVRMSRAEVLVISASRDLVPDDLLRLTALSRHLRPDVQLWCGQRRSGPRVEFDAHFSDFDVLSNLIKGL